VDENISSTDINLWMRSKKRRTAAFDCLWHVLECDLPFSIVRRSDGN